MRQNRAAHTYREALSAQRDQPHTQPERDLTSLHIHTEKRSGSATPENDGQNAATTQIMQQLMTQLAISFLENGKYSNGSSVKPESE